MDLQPGRGRAQGSQSLTRYVVGLEEASRNSIRTSPFHLTPEPRGSLVLCRPQGFSPTPLLPPPGL